MNSGAVPVPPLHLAARVGPTGGSGARDGFLGEGAALRAKILELLPDGWSFSGKRVLDFGCGSGRVLRHFLPEAGDGEFWGCDIDEDSIRWLDENLSPPLRCFTNGLSPPLPVADRSFDLVWALSVFTHIEDWAPWLLEMHRVLAPDGLLIASFLGAGMWEARVREPYREDEIGMTVVGHWTGPGADVLHSEWWLRAHWGRAFDVLEVTRPAPRADGTTPAQQSYIVLRNRPGEPTREELERISAEDSRELAALKTNLRVARYELAALAREQPLHELVASRLGGVARRSPLVTPARRLRRALLQKRANRRP